jgi:surface-anchored protein
MKRTSLAALMGVALSSAYASAATLTSGHVDFIGIGYVGGELEPHSHAHAGAVVDGSPLGADTEFEVGELTVQTYLTTTRLAGSAWDPVGVGSGQSFWTLTETETAGHPFVGIGAEELNPADWDGPITITLTGATGSGILAGGKFSLWQGSLTPNFFMSTNDGISGADVFSMDLNEGDHAHFGWGFTEQGIYDLTFEIAGTHVGDGVKSATATYSFSVIPEPSSALLGAFGALALLRRRR